MAMKITINKHFENEKNEVNYTFSFVFIKFTRKSISNKVELVSASLSD
jgi:hypothetical protein